MREGQLLSVDFYKLLRQGDLSQNIYLEPDDFVYLRSAVSRDVYVLGAVERPNIVGFSDKTFTPLSHRSQRRRHRVRLRHSRRNHPWLPEQSKDRHR